MNAEEKNKLSSTVDSLRNEIALMRSRMNDMMGQYYTIFTKLNDLTKIIDNHEAGKK